ncbi:MAG: ATP-dependent DNA helicase [Clostridia bacterium]|nr:ATP-dependent DNA helicase [Clostridia bacterium]
MEKPVIRISVRNLVEFILRSGDLDSRRGSIDKEAMLKGGRLHRKIQKQMGSNYRSEVSLKWETEYEDLTILVEGRADGIQTEEDRVTIDEIKGIYGDPEHLREPVPVHRAQAMCYARIYGEMEKLDEIDVQMTYANLDTEVIRRFRETFSMNSLREWYQELLNAYHKWVSYKLKWQKERNASMAGLEFPFPYREGQRKMVTSVYHTIACGKQIFIQAPTGIGKTMSTIFPAVRAVGEGKGDTIFYLTAKTITRKVAEEAFLILQEKGLKYKFITITAKEKLCANEEKCKCNPQDCPYAKGHFDRVNDAVYEMWTSGHIFDRNAILEQAEKWSVCPFEMSLDLAVWVDAVICDYNYVFDPNVHLKRFFGEGVSGKYIFLIDEAHNLVERGREMYSACICKEDILEVKKKVKPHAAHLARALEKVNRQLLELKKECVRYQILENPGSVPLGLLQVQGEMDKLLEEQADSELADEILDFYFTVRDFLNIAELVDENYVVYTENGEDGRFRMKLYCVNPASNLHDYLEKGVSTVFFSATLLPLHYYRKLLSTQKDDFGIYVRSPFSQEKRCILVGGDVSSRYTRRNYEEYRRIAEYIARVVWQKKGNYMVFFPSYRLLEDVFQVFEEEFSTDWVRCICQSSSMSERDREEFLEEFEKNEDSLVAFCIMGGVFSEGIDLMGEKLIGAIVVGTGIPQISNEREILKAYYTARGENGFDYAYRYPGMNKVLQAAGRVIRTQEDTGVIVLLDDRFRSPEYRNLFPMEWSDRKLCSLANAEALLKEFWSRENRKPMRLEN